MKTILLSAVLLMAIQEDACTKPTLCDEHCLRDKRLANGTPPDGSTVMAEGAKQSGTLRSAQGAPPVIVYADGSTQSAAETRITVIPAAPTPIKVEDWPAIHERNRQLIGIDKIDPCHLPENPTANQIDTYQRKCNANSRPKLPHRPGQAPEGGQR